MPVPVAVVLVVLVGSLRAYDAGFDRSCEDVPPPGAFVAVDGVRLHYLDRGSGPPVVLLHGDGGSVLDFTASPLVDLLADQARVVVIDRPGHGYSDPAHTVGSLREQATLIRGAVRALGLEDPDLAVPIVPVHGDADGNVPVAEAMRAHEVLARAAARADDPDADLP